MIRIVLADDHVMVRQGFCQLLTQEPDFAVIGEAGDGRSTLELVEQLRPEVLVLDMVMPGLKGLDVLDSARQSSPGTRVVILSMHNDPGYVLEALQHGAGAYVLKESSVQELVQAIRVVINGQHYLSPPLVEHVITAYLAGTPASLTPCPEILRIREQQVLSLIGTGQTNHEIAAALALSKRTIETYRWRLAQKLDLASQAELRQYALRQHRLPGQ
jgi:two-component system, NarL family, response regulator NreC